MKTRHGDTAQIIWEKEFDGGGQGVVSMQVLKREGDYYLSVARPFDVEERFEFMMRNAADVDIAVAEANLKTLLWRSGLWFIDAWLRWVNSALENQIIEREEGPGWVRYSCEAVKDSPFDDPELHSPIAVIDCHFSPILYKDKPRSHSTDWIVEPWSAVFLHDVSCISCLPEADDRYFFMVDLMPDLAMQAEGMPIDQGDFLGRLHRSFKPSEWQFEFLRDWGLSF